jgi:ubiquinone/menaquinone biosynthesis C-methylase UbiE
MAELEVVDQDAGAGCCSPAAQETCCEPETKGECCGSEHDAGTCGCSAGADAVPEDQGELRDTVRERYAKAAVAAGEGSASCCGDAARITEPQRGLFGSGLYDSDDRDALPETAQLASLGCGNPTAVAALTEGETVLDLGSGGGIDVLLSARRVGPTGKAYGLDMTDEMLELAQANQRQAGVENVEFVKGTIEDIPLADDSIDVIISNCVINLSGDKPRVFREAARVLRPGGRFAVSDVVADADMDEETRRDIQQWTGCIAGALTREEFERELGAAGFDEIEVRETHRVHEHAGSAIIRARLCKGRAAGERGEELPIAECRLDLDGARSQRDRYQAIGAGITRLARQPNRLDAWLAPEADRALVAEAIEIERECCPFFEIAFDPAERRLSVGVADPSQEPALDAIRYALTGES